MARDGMTYRGDERAPKTSFARTPLPRSPWQPENEPAIGTPRPLDTSDGPELEMVEVDVIDIGDVRDGIDAVAPSARRDGRVWTIRRAAGHRGRRQRRSGSLDPVIDLGEQHGAVDAEPDAVARLDRVDWMRLWRANYRPIALAVVALVALLAGGSKAPPTAAMARVSSIAMPMDAALAVDRSRALVLAGSDHVGESITSYDVNGGARQWFTELPIGWSDDVGMTLTDGVILITTGMLVGDRGPHTIAIDERTGARLWATRLDLVSPRRGSDSVLMSGGPTSLIAFDKRTGKPRWYLSVPSGCTTSAEVPGDPEVPTALVELCWRSGELRRVNLETGLVEQVRHLTLMAEKDADVSMFTVGDVVIVEDDAAVYLPRFYAYGIVNLGQLWNSYAYPETNGASACGLDVCIAAEGITVVLDAHTGKLVPQMPHAAELSQSVLQPFAPRSGVGTLIVPSAQAQAPAFDIATYV